MKSHILIFKSTFLSSRSANIQDINGFVVELIAHHAATPIQIGTDAHWNNYFHACMVSAFQECLGYDLENWNSYFDESRRISSQLGIARPNEGQVLELFVIHTINHVFDFGSNNLNIVALKSNDSKNPTYLTDDSNDPNFLTPEENRRIINNLKVVVKMRGNSDKRVWGDNDIIVTLSLNGLRQQYCIISCKTSLRERVYQSIFWAMHSRLEGVGKHVFVTTDKGASGRSEIGNRNTQNEAKKSRDVLESTMDRVYVLRRQQEVNRSQVIKDFTYLKSDLERWALDIGGI